MLKTPAFWYRPPGLIAWLLWPLSLVYRLGRTVHVASARCRVFTVPVICIGNAVAGGAGKTPTAIAIAPMVAGAHIVTRGYGGALKGPVRVTDSHTAADVGDEALLLAVVAPVWVAQNRVLGIEAAIAAGAKAVILDDGLQNPYIAATANVLVIDSAPVVGSFGNGMVLPAGPLREPLAAVINRVDAVITINAPVPDRLKDKPAFRAILKPDISQLDISARYVAFSGMARPEKFFTTARAAGLNVVMTFSYPDHHTFSGQEWLDLQRAARECNGRLLTTAKDAVRFDERQRAQLAVLPVALEFAAALALHQWLQEKTGA
jgi:tetraacyldisaccharide 4'-kinase